MPPVVTIDGCMSYSCGFDSRLMVLQTRLLVAPMAAVQVCILCQPSAGILPRGGAAMHVASSWASPATQAKLMSSGPCWKPLHGR